MNRFGRYQRVRTGRRVLALLTAPVGKSVGVEWDVVTVAGDASEAQWDVAAAISDESDIQWDVFTTISDESDIQWDVRFRYVRPTITGDYRWVADSAMIVYDADDTEYSSVPLPPLGAVFRNYDPSGQVFPNDNLYSPDAAELVVTLMEDYDANATASSLTVAKMLTTHLVASIKTDLETYTYPLTVMCERWNYGTGPWARTEGSGSEFHMRTTLMTAYAFLRLYASDTSTYDGKTLAAWALEMLDTGRKMQQFSHDRADGIDLPTWMDNSMSEWWNEGATNTTPHWAQHPLFLADVVWKAYTEAISQLGATQNRRDAGTYSLTTVRDDWFTWLEGVLDSQNALMSDFNGTYVSLPYQRMYCAGDNTGYGRNNYVPATDESDSADWTSDSMFWTTEGLALSSSSKGLTYYNTLQALRHGYPERYYDSYTVTGTRTTSPSAADDVTQASGLAVRTAGVLAVSPDVQWVVDSQITSTDDIADGAWTWTGDNVNDYVESIATAVNLWAIAQWPRIISTLLDLQWDLTALASDSAQVVWDVDALVTDDSDIQWDTYAIIADSSDLQWDVVTVAGDESEAQWDVDAPVGDSSDIQWDTYAVAGDESDIQWDVTIVAGDESDVQWDVVELASDESDIQWDVTGAVSDTSEFVWDVFLVVTDSSDFQWDVTTVAGDSSDLQWDVVTFVGDESDLQWDVTGAVSDASDIQWDTYVTVTDTSEFQWDVTTVAGDESDTQWGVDALATDSSEFVWDVSGIIGDESEFQWDVEAIGTVFDNSIFRWDVSAATGDEAGIEWDVALALGDESSVLWDIFVSIGDTSEAQWDVLNFLGDTSEFIWDVEGSVGDESDFQWDVLGAAVAQFIVLIWDITTSTGEEFSAEWDIRELVSHDGDLRWVTLRNMRFIFSKSLSRAFDYVFTMTD